MTVIPNFFPIALYLSFSHAVSPHTEDTVRAKKISAKSVFGGPGMPSIPRAGYLTKSTTLYEQKASCHPVPF